MHAYDPVDENCAHILIYVSLVAHVESVGLRLLFSCLHVLLDLLAVVTHMVDVRNGCLVHFADLGSHIVLNAALISLQFVVQANLRQFVS